MWKALQSVLNSCNKNEVQENSAKLWPWKQWKKIASIYKEGIWPYHEYAEEVPSRFP